MKTLSFILIALAAQSAFAADIVSTKAYSWHGDTVTQGPFTAYAPDAFTIISDYSAQPGYYMGIDKEWRLKNDISSYPQLITDNTLHHAAYNMALDEMVNAVEPDTTLRTGREWPGVWTRDVSYSILLSMAYMQPEATRISLMRKVDKLGRIIQDTGSGGAWPVSTDRQIWTLAAYELYKVTGDRQWLEYIYPIIKRSLYDDRDAGVIAASGLAKGETSFIDWREQSHPKWMQTADVYNTEALGTSVVFAQAWHVLSLIAADLGHKDVAADAQAQSQKIADAINRELWMAEKGYYAMYRYGRNNLIVNPRAEALGESLAVLYGIAPDSIAAVVTESVPVTPFGVGIFYPQIADVPAYHNNALWPWVGAYWALANAKAKNEQGVMQAIGAVIRPAALFATNKENFNLDNGDIATELNSSNMLWCLSGNIALTHKILFGIDFTERGLAFKPFVPEAMGGKRTLKGFKYRDAVLDITVDGYGDSIASFTVNGRKQAPLITPKQAKGNLDVVIRMCNKPIAPMTVNMQPNAKAPLTPIARLDGTELVWQPIEYIDHYIVVRDGQRIATTHSTTYDASTPGEYQVIGVSTEGIEGFASEPMSTQPKIHVQFADEKTEITSAETVYAPTGAVTGYTGNGFVELDQTSAPVSVSFDVPVAGTYALTLRYANGNGPVNTENRCALRTVSLDGKRLGTAVMPHRGRGNWSDWGVTNALDVHLTAGTHTVTVTFEPVNTNMNIDVNHALVDRLDVTLKKTDTDK